MALTFMPGTVLELTVRGAKVYTAPVSESTILCALWDRLAWRWMRERSTLCLLDTAASV